MGILYRKMQVGGKSPEKKPIQVNSMQDWLYNKMGINKDKWLNYLAVHTMGEGGLGRRTRRQDGLGPARGFLQIEPLTAGDMVENYEKAARVYKFPLPDWWEPWKKATASKIMSNGKMYTGYDVSPLGKREQIDLASAMYVDGPPRRALERFKVDGNIGKFWADGWKKLFKDNTAAKQVLIDRMNAGDTLSTKHINSLLFDDKYIDPMDHSNGVGKTQLAKDNYFYEKHGRPTYKYGEPMPTDTESVDTRSPADKWADENGYVREYRAFYPTKDEEKINKLNRK